MPDPVHDNEETFDEEVRHVEHLNAVRDEDHLNQVGHDEGSHVADVARDESEQLVEGLLFDELNDLLVRDQTSQRQNHHVRVHED